MSAAPSLIKPTIHSPFHIDFDWWKNTDSNWRVYLTGCLCPQHQDLFGNVRPDQKIDQIDPKTGEVTQIDGILSIIEAHCSQLPDFIEPSTKLLDAVFRALIINENKPLTPEELAEIIGRPASTILRTIAGGRVYLGIRPASP